MRAGYAKVAGLVSLLTVMGGLSGCPSGGQRTTGAGGANSGKVTLQFWHTRRASQEKALEAICDEFERNQPGIDVVPQYQGGYGDLVKKIRASILAKSLPAMTVAYEDNVTEYARNGVVLPLDPLLKDPSLGLSEAELADFPAPYLETNRYRQSDNQLLSFPFTKSNLVLYYNKTLMAKAGLKTPPVTWAELERQAAVITAQTGKPALSFASDASTLDGMIYSFGGEIVDPDGRHTLFDQPPMVKTLELLQRMAQARTLVEATGDDAVSMFGSQLCAFTMNSSAGRAAMEERIKDDFEWDLAVIPHAEGVKPVTVMYGPNICIFKSTPEVETAAWRFVKYFVAPETTARWARDTGYLPVRKSAVESPEMVEFYRKNPRAAHVYEVLQYARGEPNLLGWQEVRAELEKTASNVVGSGTPPATAAVDLKKTADRILAQSN
ncbi:MAG: ABC transporter substrate-binding protein [Actinomycetota bacterium]